MNTKIISNKDRETFMTDFMNAVSNLKKMYILIHITSFYDITNEKYTGVLFYYE